MNTFTRFLSGLAIGALVLAAPAMAQDKGKDAKAAKAEKAEKAGTAKLTTVLENDKVKVFEVYYKPGDENKAVPSSAYRVARAIKGGTLTRTYADGKIEKTEWKADQVRFNEPTKAAYTAKNTGNTDVHLYIVQLK